MSEPNARVRGLPIHVKKCLIPGLSKHTAGGYNVRKANVYNNGGVLRQGEKDMLTCPICTMLLRDPLQLITCGCRFCSPCLEQLIIQSDNATLTCPVDQEVFTKGDMRKDKGCSKEINSLKVDCPSTNPCEWQGLLSEMQEHESHKCPNREEYCQFCGTTVTKDEFKDHLTSCTECPIDCEFCEQGIPTRKEWQHHLEVECKEYKTVCPCNESAGCSFEDKKESMVQHVVSSHLLSTVEKVNSLTSEVEMLKSENVQLRSDLKRRDDIITQLDKRLRELESKSQRDRQFQSLQYDRYQPDLVERDSGSTRVRKPKPFNDGGMYDTASSTAVSKLRDDLEVSQNQITQLNDSMQVLQETFTQFGIAVDEVRLRQDVLDVKTTNGVFIWKIPDIRRRYTDAIERRTLSLYSPPFYTSPHGYRMCVRTYLNGDGVGKGSHISMFFVLMRSEHDSLLPFPFKQAVRFTLINQVNSANSITEAFAPDVHSPSFQRPQSDMNVASGFPRFAKQSMLHDEEFTKDNVIFIKAQVDLTGLNLN